MSYNINQLAKIANISVRTLHHYDEIGLLTSKRNIKNQYRVYEEDDLLKLQQILFFRELDFKLEEIKEILSSPNFDVTTALKDHKKMILTRRSRLDALVKTIDKTINKVTNKKHMKNKNIKDEMKDEELYNAFKDEEHAKYREEAKARWGSTEAYKQSMERVSKMTKAEMAGYKEEAEQINLDLAAHMKDSPHSALVQKIIARHYKWLSHWYEPNLQMYRGLAEMYVNDPRFAKYYDTYKTGLAQFMHDAMIVFVENQK